MSELLALDVRQDQLPLEDCQYMKPGSADAPGWLKCQLPRRPFVLADSSIVDLALPVDKNPFYQAMGKKLVKQLDDKVGSFSHTLLLGCSGKILFQNTIVFRSKIDLLRCYFRFSRLRQDLSVSCAGEGALRDLHGGAQCSIFLQSTTRIPHERGDVVEICTFPDHC